MKRKIMQTVGEFMKASVQELKDELEKCRLSTNGRKEDLRQKLIKSGNNKMGNVREVHD